MTRIIPGTDTKDRIKLDLIIGTRWDLDKQDGAKPWRLIVVYRGLHCPLCKEQLQTLSARLRDFVDAGCIVVTATMEDKARADEAHAKWELGDLPLAYELDDALVRDFGLYVSEAISDNEPDRFAEPAMLLLKNTTLHAAWVQSVPFARPTIDDLFETISFLDEKDYPPRGTA